MNGYRSFTIPMIATEVLYLDTQAIISELEAE
jgi:hypothetical protein